MRIRLSRVGGFPSRRLRPGCGATLSPGPSWYPMGWHASAPWTRRGEARLCPIQNSQKSGLGVSSGFRSQDTGGGPHSARHPQFTWVNTILGNINRSLRGTYHQLSSKHLPRYLAEFSYRFNRRFSLREMFPRLAFVALRTAPMPYRVLKLAENHF